VRERFVHVARPRRAWPDGGWRPVPAPGEPHSFHALVDLDDDGGDELLVAPLKGRETWRGDSRLLPSGAGPVLIRLPTAAWAGGPWGIRDHADVVQEGSHGDGQHFVFVQAHVHAEPQAEDGTLTSVRTNNIGADRSARIKISWLSERTTEYEFSERFSGMSSPSTSRGFSSAR